MGKLNSGFRSHPATRVLAAVGAGALVLGASAVLRDLFGPAISYSMNADLGCPVVSDEFVQFLSVVTDGAIRRCRITRLKNGAEFYPAELDAIRRARHAINLEYYNFSEGKVSSEILDALIERARGGVEVRLIVDAVGSFHTHSSWFDGLRAAGGKMRWYHPLHPQIWQRFNNRTHRKLLVVDGTTGFIGGAGIADRWLYSTPKVPAWRDTVFRVEGEAVSGLISTFSENWLEASGEILSGPKQFGFKAVPEGAKSFVVLSTPHGGGTQARILFQALIKSARKSLRITTPYFLPDRSAREALVEASERGVQVQVLTAGPFIDHPMVRKLSRDGSRRLLKAGAEIFEYQPSMIHAKLMTVDGQWNVMGSTNFDHRSFGLNDEVNLAVLDRELASVIEADFAEDLKLSRPLTLAMLQKRTLLSREEDLVDHAIKWES
jgi:cardiolipin synthase